MKLIFLLFLYMGIIFLTGVLFLKRMRSLEDFFLASRNLPPSLVFLSLAASWLGASSFLVLPDEAYSSGISSFWIMGIPASLTVLILGIFLAKKIRSLPIVSLPDLLQLRYGHAVRHLGASLIIWYMIVLASSQMVAMGHFLEVLVGVSYLEGIVFGAGIVVLYSFLGGFRSVAITDALQFFLLLAGLIVFFLFFLSEISVKEALDSALDFGRRGYLNFFLDIKKNILITLSFALAWTVSPIAWQRIQAARSAKSARIALFASSGTFLILFGSLVLAGILCLPLFHGKPFSHPLFIEVISSTRGSFLSGIMFVGLVSALMSTMDTAINTGALSLTRDLFQQLFPHCSLRGIIFLSRASTLFVSGLALLVATQFRSILKTLGLASEIMAEGLFIPGIAMIFIKKKRPLAGLLSLAAGGGFSVVGFLCESQVLKFNWPSWPVSLPYGLSLSMLGYSIGVALQEFKERMKLRQGEKFSPL